MRGRERGEKNALHVSELLCGSPRKEMPLIFSVEVIMCGGEMITFLIVIITATIFHSTAICSLYIYIY